MTYFRIRIQGWAAVTAGCLLAGRLQADIVVEHSNVEHSNVEAAPSMGVFGDPIDGPQPIQTPPPLSNPTLPPLTVPAGDFEAAPVTLPPPPVNTGVVSDGAPIVTTFVPEPSSLLLAIGPVALLRRRRLRR